MPSDTVSLYHRDDSIQTISVNTANNQNKYQRSAKEILKPHGKKNEYVSRTEMSELRKYCKNPKTYAKTLYKKCKTRKRLGYCSDNTKLDLDYSESKTHNFLFKTYTKDAEYIYRAKSGDTAASVREMFGLKDGALLKCNKWIVDANHPFEEGTPIYFLEKDIKDEW